MINRSVDDFRFTASFLEENLELVAVAVAESRNKEPRYPNDRDSREVMRDLIAALRVTANAMEAQS